MEFGPLERLKASLEDQIEMKVDHLDGHLGT